MNRIELPLIINGEICYAQEGQECFEMDYDSGVKVVIPKVTEEQIQAIKDADKFMLHDVHFQDVINALVKVGFFWAADNQEHPLYQKAMRYLSAINGYDLKMAQRELNIINVMCSFGDVLHDMLDAELGNKYYLEEWIPLQDGIVHAQPQGNLLNVMVGNVPISSVMSLVRSIITKNHTIAKLPKRDPITALFFALSFVEILKDDPVTKSLNVLYWPGGDEIEDKMIDLADVICVWGGGEAVKSIKAKAVNCAEVIEFGPKQSFSIIGKESRESKKVAIDLAHDMSIYNQEACFSPQMAFVEGDPEIFIQNLKEGLELYKRILPKGMAPADIHSHVQRARIEARYMGKEVIASDDTQWTIIKINDPSEIDEHPLSRTIYVMSVNDIKDVLKYVTKHTQTITMSPWSRNVEIRDRATLLGASKITELGLAEYQRNGCPHDNIFPLHKMVKWVGVERGLDHLGKHIVEGPVDTTLWLMLNADMLEQDTQSDK